MVAALAACTSTPSPSSASQERYSAHGQEPGWTVTIAHGRIDYVGDYGATHISVPRPEPRTTFNGHRYETPRLSVDITHGHCNDAMSGQGFADQVMVIADGRTVRGCGGARHGEWDQ
jgi:heat shock protein HslJ